MFLCRLSYLTLFAPFILQNTSRLHYERHIKIVLKEVCTLIGKSELYLCTAYLNRNYYFPDSHPQYLFEL